MYSHLLHNATDRMHQNQQPHPPPPQRSQSAREISGSAESADDKDLAAAKAAAVAACAGDKSEPNIRIADEQLAQEEAKAEAAAQRHEDTSRQQQQQEEDGDGLMLAADHIIASRATTQNTIMSVPEVYQPQRRSHDLPPLQPVVSRHPSLPETNYSPSVAAAHHRGGNVLRQRRRQSARRSSVSGIRRILRRRPREEAGDQMCQFIGNRTNPLGRRADGELVDYDDPDDDDMEQGFMDNNVDDRFIDYLTVDIGAGIRRLASKLPVLAGRRQSIDEDRPAPDTDA
ncbi:hypothetical protein IW150_005786 [Coemansia sp. RSA 2607]|nr:hypothetical protein IW150_005786 [Coemansia sp. RSA 2607]